LNRPKYQAIEDGHLAFGPPVGPLTHGTSKASVPGVQLVQMDRRLKLWLNHDLDRPNGVTGFELVNMYGVRCRTRPSTVLRKAVDSRDLWKIPAVIVYLVIPVFHGNRMSGGLGFALFLGARGARAAACHNVGARGARAATTRLQVTRVLLRFQCCMWWLYAGHSRCGGEVRSRNQQRA
jgi:hypothetical protein